MNLLARAPAWQLTLGVEGRGGRDHQTLVIRKDRIVIGRVSGNDIVLPSDNVSRHHCTLEVRTDGTVIASDAGSTNGTFLNGDRIDGAAPLRVGDKLYVGNFFISLARDPERVD